MLKCVLQTPTTGRDATYNLNVERRHAVGVTLLWSEIVGGDNTPDSVVTYTYIICLKSLCGQRRVCLFLDDCQFQRARALFQEGRTPRCVQWSDAGIAPLYTVHRRTQGRRSAAPDSLRPNLPEDCRCPMIGYPFTIIRPDRSYS